MEILTVPVTRGVDPFEDSEAVPAGTAKPSEPHPDPTPTTPAMPEATPAGDNGADAPTPPPPGAEVTTQRKTTRIGKSELIGFGIGVVAVVLVIGFILHQIFWKDTWESDNYYAIMRIRDEALSCFDSKGYESAIAKHNELLVLVGDREIRRSELGEAVSETKTLAVRARQALAEPTLSKLREMEARAKASAEKNEFEKALKTYDEALNLARDSQTENALFAPAISRISGAKDVAAKQWSVRQKAIRKEQEERERKSIPDAQAFLEAAQPFAKRAARISSLYRVELSHTDFGDELKELRVAYDQALKAPNAMCNQVTALLDAYMRDAQHLMKMWKYKIGGEPSMEPALKKAGDLPSQLLPKLCSRQKALAAAIAELEKKLQ